MRVVASFLTVGILLSWSMLQTLVAADANRGANGTLQSDLPRGVVASEPQEGPSVKIDSGWMVPYTETIPGTDVEIEMVPVPGGVFTFGSSPDDQERGEYELDAVEVELPPFWIARHETTWAAYWKYMQLNSDFAAFESIKGRLSSNIASQAKAAKEIMEELPAIAVTVDQKVTYVDGVTAPTALYDESTTYECGQDPQQPAATMTPYAAKQFSKWLSKTTGTDYRLPTEAEWEYAARAGTDTVYPGGDDAENLGDYAWYDENSDYVTHPVGQKKPNAWGIYDMIGNVAELVIDEYSEEVERPENRPLTWEQAVVWPTTIERRMVRGGFYDATAEECRLTSRIYTEDADWKASDPNSPLSPWWYADYPSTGVGFRLVRPLEPLSPELATKFWEFDSEEIEEDVESRIAGRRGKLGPANPTLPKAQAALEDERVKALLEGGD